MAVLCPAQGDGARILEIEDQALVAKVWTTIFSDSVVPRGEYQILFPADGAATVLLLRDGTEVGPLPLAEWERLSATSTKTAWWKRALQAPDSKDAPTVWGAMDVDWKAWMARAEWPAEFMVGVGSRLSAIPHSDMQFQREIDFAWNQKLYHHFLLGGALHRTQFGGGLTRAWEARQLQGVIGEEPNFWGDSYWWWSLTAGVPGVRYTMSLANQPLPEYFWLETRADSLIRNQEEGPVVRQWTGDELAISGNLAHSLQVKLAYFRYGLRWDGDAYSSAIHTFGVEEVPAFFGAWGAGVVATSGVAATRVWVDIPDLAFTLPMPADYPSSFRLAFLRLDFTYRTLRSFSLGLAVTVRLDNPIFNLPGV